MNRRLAGRRVAGHAVACAVAACILVLASATGAAASASDVPVPVTPYQGFNTILARAPYVTDLTQTGAYVTWATTSQTPGSIKVAATVNGSCPGSTAQWDTSAIKVTTSLPGPVNPVNSAGSASMTGWTYSVVDRNGVTVHEYQSSVRVEGLAPGTQYCYAVFSKATAGAVDLMPAGASTQRFTTLDGSSATRSQTFAVLADTGENYYNTISSAVAFPNGVNPYQAALLSLIGRSGARFLVSGGDIAYSGGSQSNYGDLTHTGTQPEISNVFGPSYFPQTGGIPTFAASGNHGQNVVTLRNWPTAATAQASGGTYALDTYSGVDGISGSFPDNWYAFSSGNVRIYVLDVAWADSALGTTTGSLCATPSACRGYQADFDEHWRPTSAEYRWLAGDLAAHPGGVKLAVFHFPLRSDNATQPSDPYLQNDPVNPAAATSLEALLWNNGVRIAFSGHAHTYQRIAPRRTGQLVSYVVGGGGGVLEPVSGGSTCKTLLNTADVYAIGWSPSKTTAGAGKGSYCGPAVNQGSDALAAATPQSAADAYSFALVTVTGTSVRVVGVNSAGQTFDDQTYDLSGV
jgi:hypothetical protein